MESKDQAKQAANKAREAFSKKDYPTAIKAYTEAIQFDPTDHLFFSNRSACYASLNQYQDALEDAEKCISLKPDFARGYGRKGLALCYLQKYEESIQAYEAGLKVDPENAQLKQGLSDVKAQMEETEYSGGPGGPGGPGQSPFGSPQEIMQKLLTNPVTKEYFKDQDFITKLQLCQTNPQILFTLMQQDPRFNKVFSVITGIDMEELQKAAKETKKGQEEQKRKEAESAGFKAEQEKEEKRKEEEAKLTPEQKEEVKKKHQAEEEKLKGNDAYRKKDYEEALKYYISACELNPNEPIYFLNKASVFLEQLKYEDCLNACDTALTLAENIKPRPFEKIAKSYARKGNCFAQMIKYAEAIEMYDKALLEVNDQNIKDAKKNIEKLKQQKEEEDYLDPAKAEEHKEKGNKLFREGNFGEAIKEYDEAVKRNPKSAVIFLNRALSYMKVLEHARALGDIEKSLQLDPNYVKAYAKKGNIHYFLKEYHKAIEAYEKGLKLEPGNEECVDGLNKVQTAIYTSTEPDEERLKRAMADPEIQAILQDPRIQQVLKEAKEGRPIGGAMSDPFISQAIQKLVAAGIIKVGH